MTVDKNAMRHFLTTYARPALTEFGFRSRGQRFWYVAPKGAVLQIIFQRAAGWDDLRFYLEPAFTSAASAAEMTAEGLAPYQFPASGWRLQAPPGFAETHPTRDSRWFGPPDLLGPELARVLRGVAPVLIDRLLAEYDDPANPPIPGVGPRPGRPIGPFGYPLFSAAGKLQAYHETGDVEEMTQILEGLERDYPGNEWVAYWRKRLDDRRAQEV